MSLANQDNLPAPIKIENLRSHFRNTYGLTEEQIEKMLISSAKSLATTLSKLYDSLEKEEDLPELNRLGHSLKGLLLNMGEQEWAAIARHLEKSAAAGEPENYREIASSIGGGAEDIVRMAG